MKLYTGELKVGTPLIYNGEVIEWCNPRTGKVNEVMKQGEYIISSITSKYIRVKPNRKNAVTEHTLLKNEIEGHVKVIEFSDLTCTAGLIFLNLNNPVWILADDDYRKTMSSAKRYNKRG